MNVSVPGGTVEQTPDGLRIVGAGTSVSEPILLAEGNHLVQVRYEGGEDYVNLDIKAAPGSPGVINYASIISGDPLPFSGEFLVEVYDTGEFVVVAEGSGEYTLIISG